jgi:hypothetical protein
MPTKALGVNIPHVAQQVFSLRVVLPYPLQAALDEALDVVLVQSQTQVELLATQPWS